MLPVPMAHKGQLVHQVQQASKVFKVSRDQVVLLVHKEFKVFKELAVHKGQQGLVEQQGLMVHKVQ